MSDMNSAELNPSRPAGEVVSESIGKLVKQADVHAVFGEPIKVGETLVIPAAEVISALGFGFGSGEFEVEREPEAEAPADEKTPGAGTGGGGGGGGYTFSRPVAMIVVNQNGVQIQQVLDMTKIGLAAISAFGFMAATIAGFFRTRK